MNDRTLEVAKHFVSKFVELPDDQLQEFAAIITKKEVKKGELLLKMGEISKNMIFVNKGLLRIYYFKGDREVTEFFVREDKHCLSCIESIFKKKESYMYIEAITKSECYLIPYHKVIEMAATRPLFANLIIKILEGALIISQQREDSLRFEGANDRYNKFIKEFPEIMKLAPLNYVASYLQMTPESLSRVRAGLL